MNYEIIGNTVPVVEVHLNAGESMYTQSGGMVWQTDGIMMDTNAQGGLMRGLGRMFAGESLFMAHYTAQRDNSTVAFATTVPGTILPVNISEMQGMYIQKGAFLCAQQSVDLKVEFTRKFSAGLFGGEGFILQSLSGKGMAFLEIDGDVVEKVLAPGEVLKVDTGNVVAFESTVRYDIETVPGLKNMFFGGEGAFLTRLTGPGQVILQSMNFMDFASKINALVPRNNN